MPSMVAPLLLLVLLCYSVSGAFHASSYTNSETLRENAYKLHWKIVADEIFLALEVSTTGWVGFGLAEPTSGSMPGADMLIGYVSNDVVTIQDRHALAKEEPVMDDCQNWELLSGEETNGKTIIEVKRKLVTGDTQDRPITEGTVRIVWAYGATDAFGYHGGSTRQATTVVFFGQSIDPKIPNTPDIKILDLHNEDYEIPSDETTYQHHVYSLAQFQQDMHIVAFEPLLSDASRHFVHHFLVYGCYDEEGIYCATTWAWAPGIEIFVAPPEAGFRVGPSPEAYKTILMEIHFTNFEHASGVLDQSGIRVHYTAKLREHDLDVLQLGDALITQHPIPQGEGIVTFEYNCPMECTAKYPHALHVVSDLLHMHKAGSIMYSTQWRHGALVREINRVEFYQYDFQHTIPLSFTIEPGDRLNTHCTYHKNSDHAIPFGLGSREEMCMEYLAYWPKLPNPPGPAGCGFMHDPALGRNFTICDNEYLQVDGEYTYNPTVMDPPGGDLIRFGVKNPGVYQCADVVTSMPAAEQSNHASGLIAPLFFVFCSILFAMM